MSEVFADRRSAGIKLAQKLKRLQLAKPLIVLALPRGGVPVAYEVARTLRAPLDVLVVRKIGMPGQPELAIGAIASGNVIVRQAGTPGVAGMAFERIAEAEQVELARREHAYRRDAPPYNLTGKTAVLVDDGLATGSTMLAAVRAARQSGAKAVVVAAPVASDEAVALIQSEADRVEVLETPLWLRSIGEWYANFEQVTDAEVCTLLDEARTPRSNRNGALSRA